MNTHIFKLSLICTMTIAICAGSVFATQIANGSGEPCQVPARTLKELRATSFATARYHSIAIAETDGYVDIDLPIPNMGEHWVNWDLVNDGEFDATKPEALVYNDVGGDRLQLVAVEYIVPISASPTAPEGFYGDCDDWHVFGGVFWTLHAWIWYPNPDGVFAELNPNVP